MRFLSDWWFPDGERSIPAWMQQHYMLINGRMAYQGDKQLECLENCKHMGVAIDVGAHVGLWSFNLSKAFGHVHSFEPVEEHRQCFIENTAGLENITLHPYALGAAPGLVSIFAEECNSGMSHVSGDGLIEMRTLDSFDLKDVDFLKIDCEGYEENVLLGGLETVKTWKPVIIVEQKHAMAERYGQASLGAVELLKTLGYKVVKEQSGDYIMVPQ